MLRQVSGTWENCLPKISSSLKLPGSFLEGRGRWVLRRIYFGHQQPQAGQAHFSLSWAHSPIGCLLCGSPLRASALASFTFLSFFSFLNFVVVIVFFFFLNWRHSHFILGQVSFPYLPKTFYLYVCNFYPRHLWPLHTWSSSFLLSGSLPVMTFLQGAILGWGP